MDQGAHRGGALHGVGEPDVERDLRALAAGAHEQAESDHGQGSAPGLVDGEVGGRGHDGAEVQAPEGDEDQEHAEEKARVSYPVHDERLLARVGGALLLEPEPDQEVGAKADPLPAHEQHQVVRAQDQGEHREHEQVQVGHVAGVAGIVAHVSDRVDMDKEAHEGHDQDHDGREGIHLVGPIHPEGGRDAGGGRGRDPLPEGLHQRVLGGAPGLEDGVERNEEGERHRAAGHQADDRRGGRLAMAGGLSVGLPASQAPAPDEVEQEAEQGQERDEVDELHRRSAGRRRPARERIGVASKSGWIL